MAINDLNIQSKDELTALDIAVKNDKDIMGLKSRGGKSSQDNEVRMSSGMTPGKNSAKSSCCIIF